MKPSDIGLKYRALIEEWRAFQISVSVYFSVSAFSFILSLIFQNQLATLISFLMMCIFAWYEYRIRAKYVEAKRKLEAEFLRKNYPEIVRKGILW